MTRLTIGTWTMPAAALGPENPLPPLIAPPGIPARIKVHSSVPDAARRFLGYGCGAGCLPYRLQDGYDRALRPRTFKTAVLENDLLRATFLLELGGRLWSLVHKPTGRELLYVNPVFQPANLAIRNAWFSGGVEWNVGVPGHSPLACEPVFAARIPDGLRIYEWERIRQAPFRIDFTLRDGVPWLFARVRLVNPHRREIPMYWWSNIAVPETETTRVLAPADAAYSFGAGAELARIPIGDLYPSQLPAATDYFYDIPEGRRPWIAALDDGVGLVQTSTMPQRGRKLWAWGRNAGGRRWQEFLGGRYIEIQAGVARTQFECFPMAPGSELSWIEAYGMMEARDRREIESKLPSLEPQSPAAPIEIVHQGSGWGALEQRLSGWADPEIPFDSMGQDQAPWLALLEKGEMPDGKPGAWMIQDDWKRRLEESRGDPWLKWLHLGVMHYPSDRAIEDWKRSLRHRRSALALRNLALATKNADLWLEAYELEPGLPLGIECGRALIDAGRSAEFLNRKWPEHGRMRILEARAALLTGDRKRAESILRGDLVVPDIREGERELSDLWQQLHPGRPLPPNLDFRMS